jgi:hypothetical protein
MWPFKKKKIEEPVVQVTPEQDAQAKVNILTQDVLVNPAPDEADKADHFRMEHITRYLAEKAEAGLSVPEGKLKFLLAEAEFLAAKVKFNKIKKELENGDNNPA